MFENFVQQPTPSVLFKSSPEPLAQAPSWFPEALLLAQYWKNTGLLQKLQNEVRVQRGRSGDYEVCDFILLMLAYAVSGLHSFKTCRTLLAPFDKILASVWERKKLPSGSALSRFLDDVDENSLEQLRECLFANLLKHGVELSAVGGFFDRTGGRNVCIDLDPSVEASRQRALCTSKEYPEPRRHRKKSSIPGYKGSKRGQVACSRATLQQSHTSEWLGTWATPGKVQIWEQLKQTASCIVAYMESKGLEGKEALLRADGAYGFAETAVILKQHNIGYIVRCVTYGLLAQQKIRNSIKHQTPVIFEQLDTGVVREVYDVGEIEWKMKKEPQDSVTTRLLVARRKHPKGEKSNIGKRRGAWVYELFATDRSAQAFTATDMLSIYFGRGGFESTLAQEDRECDPGRWLSNDLHGQSFWQLLCQSCWNLRLRLGALSTPEELVRKTLWAESMESQKSRQEDEQNDEFKCAQGLSLEQLTDFESAKHSNRLVFRAPMKFCRVCPSKQECQLTEKHTKKRRKVLLVFSEEEDKRSRAREREERGPLAFVGPSAVMLEDLRASQLRNNWRQRLARQKMEIELICNARSKEKTKERIYTRAQRARRRLSWSQRLAKNQLQPGRQQFLITFHGLLHEIAKSIGFSC